MPSVPIAASGLSLADFRTLTESGMQRAGLSPELVAGLGEMHRLERLKKSVVAYEHFVYEEDAGPDDILRRRGFMLLLGEKNGNIVGLTTQCGINFEYPRYGYWDSAEVDGPEFVAGVFVLRLPGRQDYYLVQHETDLSHRLARAPYGRFVSEFLGGMGMTKDTWSLLLQSGDRVVMESVGNNDLAFVTFTKRRTLGAMLAQTAAGVTVGEVMRDSAAFRVGLQQGDVLVSVAGVPVREGRSLANALEAMTGQDETVIQFRRGGRVISRRFVFDASTNLFESGDLTHLGLSDPRSIVADLLREQQRLGGLLRRELTARCNFCNEAEQRAQLKRTPTALESLLRIIPVAGGLLGMEAGLKWQFGQAHNALKSFIDNSNTLADLFSTPAEMERFLRGSFAMGEPVLVEASAVEVLSGDRLRMPDSSGRVKTWRLAYTNAPSDAAKACLEEIVRAAAKDSLAVLAIPDGVDPQGNTHCHLLVVRPGRAMRRGLSFEEARGLGLEVYVNLVLIREGLATAQDHGVGHKATSYVLKGLRLLETDR